MVEPLELGVSVFPRRDDFCFLLCVDGKACVGDTLLRERIPPRHKVPNGFTNGTIPEARCDSTFPTDTRYMCYVARYWMPNRQRNSLAIISGLETFDKSIPHHLAGLDEAPRGLVLGAGCRAAARAL